MNSEKLKLTNLIELCLIILFKILLDYLYINYISTNFSYMNFLCDFNIAKYIFGWIIYIFVFFILKLKRNIYLFELYYILFLLFVAPNIVYYSLSNEKTYFFLLLIVPYILILVFTINYNRKIVLFKIKHINYLLIVFSLIVSLIVIIHYILISHGNYVIKFNEVYVFRNKFSFAYSKGIFGYLNSWVGKVFVIFIFAISIKSKKIFLILISILLILGLYVFSGQKSMLAGLFIVPFFYFLFNINKNIRCLIIVLIFLFLIILSWSIGVFFHEKIIPSIIIRRLFFLPIQLNYVYFDFFSYHSFAYWGNSIFKFLVDYPYNEVIPKIIGIYLGHPNENANTGFIASAYAQFGILGVMFYTVILILISNILNTISKNLDKFLVYSIISMPVLSIFISSDLFTCFLTHGLIISIFLIMFYKSEKRLNKGKLCIKLQT